MNAIILLGMPGGAEMIVLLFVLLLLFGGTRLPQLAKGLGQSIREFKKGVALGDAADEMEGGARSMAGLRAAEANGFGAEDVRRDGLIVTGGR